MYEQLINIFNPVSKTYPEITYENTQKLIEFTNLNLEQNSVFLDIGSMETML
tara:strand:- start:262 stop:417 length:156 start_codon:yes stop_codon:yes gene_type:complete